MTLRCNNSWFDNLQEGVILVESGCVSHINRAALLFLDISSESVLKAPLITVVRDHRIEQAYLEGKVQEIETKGRILEVYGISSGLILQDLTEVRKSQENATELLAVLSHELRTPITTIRSTIEAFQYELSDEQKERFLSRAKSEVERLSRLVEDLTVDVKPPIMRRLDLSEHIKRALSVLQETFTHREVTVNYDIPELIVKADSDKLIQVLINLLENAALYGPPNAIINLLVETNHKHEKVLIKVQDSGTPLEKKFISGLFEPHSRGKSSKAKGVGLGLYIVRNITKSWGGESWGKALENGNEFGFSIPLSH